MAITVVPTGFEGFGDAISQGMLTGYAGALKKKEMAADAEKWKTTIKAELAKSGYIQATGDKSLFNLGGDFGGYVKDPTNPDNILKEAQARYFGGAVAPLQTQDASTDALKGFDWSKVDYSKLKGWNPQSGQRVFLDTDTGEISFGGTK
jgi:hypothetical protein